MKRLITTAVAAAMCLALNAYAKTSTIEGFTDNGKLTIAHSGDKSALIAVYDGDGKLIYGNRSANAEGKYVFDMPKGMTDNDIRLIMDEDDIYGVAVAEATPLPTEAPTEAPTETPTPFPTVYEKEINAVHAPALVKKMTKTVDSDGELIYRLFMLYQGAEIEADVKETVTIASAPAEHSYASGETASSLKEGDIIHFVCGLNHRIKSIELIYRSDFKDYIKNGINMTGLVGADSRNKYVFGVPVKAERGYISLAAANGTVKDVDVADGAFVYGVKNVSKGYRTELIGLGAKSVPRVAVPNNIFDDNGNVSSWTDIDTEYYALARLVDGAATDIFVVQY